MTKTKAQLKLRYLPLIGWFHFIVTNRYTSLTLFGLGCDIQWPNKDGKYNFINKTKSITVFGLRFRCFPHSINKGKWLKPMFTK